MLKTLLCCLFTSFAVQYIPCQASPLGEGAFDTINISADEASEDEQTGALHFKGHFLMQSDDWWLESSQATVYGRPDRPDKINLEGSPASFFIKRVASDPLSMIKATAPVIEYIRDANILKLSGGAILQLDDEVISSSSIEFNLDTERYRTSGAGGVTIKVPPVN